jgi:mycothione reductase
MLAIRDRIFGRVAPISERGREFRATGHPHIVLIEGTARFVDNHTLDVDGRRISARHVLIAVGARPAVPPIAGLTETGFHTSDTIMRLDALPERLGVIGGGYIAAEMSHVFASFGTNVSIFNRSERLLRSLDREISERFTDLLRRRIDLHLGCLPTHVERTSTGILIHVPGRQIEVDELLVATGRVPNSDLLDTGRAGLELRSGGTIKVDAYMQSSTDGVWAIGDVANQWQLKHVANAEARVALWNIAHPDRLRSIDYKAVPAAVFSSPQVATLGMTEQAARQLQPDVAVGRCEYAGTAYGWALEDTTSFAKVIIDSKTGLIIGAHILGPQAATLIQPLVQAMQFEQKADQLARGQYWTHPAPPEVVENALLDALRQIHG